MSLQKVPATFTYNGRTYKHITPVKRLLQSTMVYDVIMRGDVFGMDVDTQEFTVIPRDKINQPAQASLDLK